MTTLRLISFLMLMAISSEAFAQSASKLGSSDSSGPEVAPAKVEKSDLREITKKKEAKDDEGFVFAISRVLGKDQNNLDALNALGVHYIEKGMVGLAKIVINRALEAHPESHTLYNNLAIIHLSESEQRMAINAIKKAIQLKPDYEIGLANLGSIYVEYGDYQKAVEPLSEGYSVTKALIKQRDDNAVKVANNYAVALVGTGEFEKARDVYKNILDVESRNIGVLYNYASLLIENLREAKESRKVLSRLKFIADDKKLLSKAKRLEKLLEDLEAEKSQ